MDKKRKIHKSSQEKLKMLEGVDTSKLTQKQLALLLGFNSNTARQACSRFLKAYNIKFKLSEQKTLNKKRLKMLEGIDTSKMTSKEISEKLKMNSRKKVYAFIRKNNIDYKREK